MNDLTQFGNYGNLPESIQYEMAEADLVVTVGSHERRGWRNGHILYQAEGVWQENSFYMTKYTSIKWAWGGQFGLSRALSSCDVYRLFPDADNLIKADMPIGVVRGDCHISKYYATCPDPLNVPGCQMVLAKFLDDSPVAVRYRKSECYDI